MADLIISEAAQSKSAGAEAETPKAFRKNSQTWFLTYPKCPLTPDVMLEESRKWGFNQEVYLIAQEQHLDGTYHLHCYFRFDHKLNIKNPRRFDVTNNGETYHPNIQTPRSPEAVIKYVTKDGKYVTNMSQTTIEKAQLKNVKVGDLYQQAMEKAKVDFDEGWAVLQHSKTYRDLAVHGEAIERNLRRAKRQKTTPKYTLDQFEVTFEWDKTKTLVLYGPTNTGKTSLAKALLPNALFVRHVDALKEYKSGAYVGIIFDDMSFKHWPREAQIHLLDTDNVSQINVKHGIAVIPEGTPRLITTNMAPNEILSINMMNPDECALFRRCQLEWIEKKVWGTLRTLNTST